LILGGAAGNLIDRVRQGYVVDFVDVYWGDWHFWAFNVADAAISVGVAIIILDLLRPAQAKSSSDMAHESEPSSVS
jgi:signal peptidase II